jgi:hypothetical protein
MSRVRFGMRLCGPVPFWGKGGRAEIRGQTSEVRDQKSDTDINISASELAATDF